MKRMALLLLILVLLVVSPVTSAQEESRNLGRPQWINTENLIFSSSPSIKDYRSTGDIDSFWVGVNLQAGMVSEILNVPTLTEHDVYILPDRRRLYVAGRRKATDIFLGESGQDSRNLTNTPDIHEGNLVVSSDGKVAVFTSAETLDSSRDIYLLDIQSESISRITEGIASERWITLNHDGTLLAWVQDEANVGMSGKVCWQPVTVGQMDCLVTGLVGAYDLTFAQTSNLLAFSGFDGNPLGSRNIYVINTDDGRLTDLGPVFGSYFSWMPDGSLIVFDRVDMTIHAVFQYDVQKATREMLFVLDGICHTDSYRFIWPAVSPDGSRLAFNAFIWPSRAELICVVDLPTGRNARVIAGG